MIEFLASKWWAGIGALAAVAGLVYTIKHNNAKHKNKDEHRENELMELCGTYYGYHHVKSDGPLNAKIKVVYSSTNNHLDISLYYLNHGFEFTGTMNSNNSSLYCDLVSKKNGERMYFILNKPLRECKKLTGLFLGISAKREPMAGKIYMEKKEMTFDPSEPRNENIELDEQIIENLKGISSKVIIAREA